MFVSDLLFVNTLMSSLRDIKVFTKKEKENEGWEKKETHHGFDLREPVKELT